MTNAWTRRCWLGGWEQAAYGGVNGCESDGCSQPGMNGRGSDVGLFLASPWMNQLLDGHERPSVVEKIYGTRMIGRGEQTELIWALSWS